MAAIMSAKAAYATPMFHVAEIEKSIRFYELLGFKTIDTDRAKPLGWARLHCEGGAIMFLRAEEPPELSRCPVMLCMYSPDLSGLRAQLLASGIPVADIRHPAYMPSGEVTLVDPDGYHVLVSHWGKAEQDAWQERINVGES